MFGIRSFSSTSLKAPPPSSPSFSTSASPSARASPLASPIPHNVRGDANHAIAPTPHINHPYALVTPSEALKTARLAEDALAAWAEYRVTLVNAGRAGRKLAGAMKDLSARSDKTDIAAQAIRPTAQVLDDLSDLTIRHAKRIERDLEDAQSAMTKHAKNLNREVKSHEGYISAVAKKQDKAEKTYKKASKAMSDSAGAHTQFARTRDAVAEDIDRASRDHILCLSAMQSKAILRIASCTAGLVGALTGYHAEGLRKAGERAGDAEYFRAMCDIEWYASLPNLQDEQQEESRRERIRMAKLRVVAGEQDVLGLDGFGSGSGSGAGASAGVGVGAGVGARVKAYDQPDYFTYRQADDRCQGDDRDKRGGGDEMDRPGNEMERINGNRERDQTYPSSGAPPYTPTPTSATTQSTSSSGILSTGLTHSTSTHGSISASSSLTMVSTGHNGQTNKQVQRGMSTPVPEPATSESTHTQAPKTTANMPLRQPRRAPDSPVEQYTSPSSSRLTSTSTSTSTSTALSISPGPNTPTRKQVSFPPTPVSIQTPPSSRTKAISTPNPTYSTSTLHQRQKTVSQLAAALESRFTAGPAGPSSPNVGGGGIRPRNSFWVDGGLKPVDEASLPPTLKQIRRTSVPPFSLPRPNGPPNGPPSNSVQSTNEVNRANRTVSPLALDGSVTDNVLAKTSATTSASAPHNTASGGLVEERTTQTRPRGARSVSSGAALITTSRPAQLHGAGAGVGGDGSGSGTGTETRTDSASALTIPAIPANASRPRVLSASSVPILERMFRWGSGGGGGSSSGASTSHVNEPVRGDRLFINPPLPLPLPLPPSDNHRTDGPSSAGPARSSDSSARPIDIPTGIGIGIGVPPASGAGYTSMTARGASQSQSWTDVRHASQTMHAMPGERTRMAQAQVELVAPRPTRATPVGGLSPQLRAYGMD